MMGLGYNILLVDDEPSVLEVVGNTLRGELDSSIILCKDPLNAIEVAQQKEIALLFTDLRMPAMDGLTLATKIRELRPNTVCVMFTGWATKEVLIKGLNEGIIWRCLEKPCPAESLVSTAREALAAYRTNVKATSKKRQSGFLGIGSQSDHRVKIKKSKHLDREHAKMARIITGKRYRDLEQIAHGGNGVIYKATDTLLEMPVAIKVLAPHLTKDEQAVEELFAEARIAMQLSHKHIVRLHNIEEVHKSYYLVMEYIEGVTLRDVLNDCGRFPGETVLQIAQICDDAIGYAHRREVYHRDLKPENFMLRNDETLKIIDFGLACLSERPAGDGMICGTPFYVSPEELRSEKIDQRSDLFSLAVVFHELLTGNIPFGDDQGEDTDMEKFVAVPSKDLPCGLQEVFKKAFEPNPDDRYDDIHDFIKAFKNVCPS